MDKDKAKEVFHGLFNKINNICVAISAAKDTIKHPDAGQTCSEALSADLLNALHKIEENIRALNVSLEEVYKTIKHE